MARYGIASPKVFGVSVANTRVLARQLGRDHELALELWESGWLEARILATLVDEPGRVTRAQMDRWARDFDNWAVCDAACMNLFDRTPHAWAKVEQWSRRRREFVKRAAFALIAASAVHDKHAADDRFLHALALVEREAADGRNFVKKAVSWALRSIGKRNARLRSAAVVAARRLASSQGDASPRWIGKDALRELI